MTARLPGVRLRTDHLTAAQLEALRARAAALARPEGEADDGGRLESLVTFFLGEVRCAVALGAVARVVQRLHRVVPLAGVAPTVSGVAFIDNQPRLVVDLLHATTGVARDNHQLANAPALLVGTGQAAIAVAVEGPLELLDAHTRALPAAPDGRLERLQLSGRLQDGAHVVDASWLTNWAQRLGAPEAPGDGR